MNETQTRDWANQERPNPPSIGPIVTNGYGSSDSGLPVRPRASVAFRTQDSTLEVLGTEVEYFQNVEIHSSTTWEDICKELMPLPGFSPIVNHLHMVFGAVGKIRTYSGQWRRLQGMCVVTSRILAHQYERYQAEPERLKLLQRICDTLAGTIANISITAQKWSEKKWLEAFVSYDSMEKEMSDHFLALGDILRTMVSTSQILSETWSSEIAKSLEEERETLKSIREILNGQNDTLAQLMQAIQEQGEKIARLLEENKATVEHVLSQKMSQTQDDQGDPEETDRLIKTIIQITGVEIPTEVFQTESCILEPGVNPIQGGASAVFKARLARGQLVAKKVFYLNKYSEGDVKTYAMKMTRDVKQWRKFDSKYTLQCLGVGMERCSDTQFNLYMLSPWIENMDSLKYLKNNRQVIGPRRILRIVADSALGLVEIHRKGSVHSNMRAQHVLVRANGRGVLGGFGLTKALQNLSTGLLPSVEQTGQFLPYRWMAPECHTHGPDNPEVTVANDVWGWAMTALEASAPPIRRINPRGEMGWPCESPVSDLNIAEQRGEYPEWEVHAYHPNMLWSLLSKCWEFEADKRPNMEVVSNGLERIIKEPHGGKVQS